MNDDLIQPTGGFSLREATLFGFGHRHESSFDGTLRLAFVLDGFARQVGVEVRQDADGGVRVRVLGGDDGDRTTAVAQVRRVLSLDHDARAYEAVCDRDPVLAQLRRRAVGLRPVLFASPYEAAVWAVLSARRHAAQAAAIRERLAREHGRTFTLAGRSVPALPTPGQLLEVDAIPGPPAARVGWLHGIARAALAGQLDPAGLSRLDPAQAQARLCHLDGIGPFHAALIHVRATGVADVLPTKEPRLSALVDRLYGRPPGELGEAWRPFRTWAAVLIRAAAGRLGEELSDSLARIPA